jgi:YHS domain-containing protein
VEAFVYFILWVAVSMLALRLGMGASATRRGRDRAARSASDRNGSHASLRWVAPETDTDPVCGRTVDPARAKPSVYDGYVYYFCSRECREQFETAPATCIKRATGDRASEAGGRR